eukprot:448088-Rhodomonas_salina.3
MLETSTICTGDHQVQSVGFHFDATAKSQLEKQHVTEEMRNTMCGTKLGSTVLYLSYARCCTDIARAYGTYIANGGRDADDTANGAIRLVVRYATTMRSLGTEIGYEGSEWGWHVTFPPRYSLHIPIPYVLSGTDDVSCYVFSMACPVPHPCPPTLCLSSSTGIMMPCYAFYAMSGTVNALLCDFQYWHSYDPRGLLCGVRY